MAETLSAPTSGTRTDLRPGAEPVAAAPHAAEAELVEEELLVEEISIDGMCGVY